MVAADTCPPAPRGSTPRVAPTATVGRLRRLARTTRFLVAVTTKRLCCPRLFISPIVAELFITHRCNLRCVSCGCWRSPSAHELGTERWKSIIRQLGELGFVKLNFTGGEPLLRDDLVALTRWATRFTDAELHLNTNGVLLKPTVAARLIDAGVRSYNVSLDGPDAPLNDFLRGRTGAFDVTVSHLRSLAQLKDDHRLSIRLCATVMRSNVAHIPDVARLADDLGVSLYLNIVTDRTFLFRHESVASVMDVDGLSVQALMEELLHLKRQMPRALPRYSVLASMAKHLIDPAQQRTPCVESQLKLMIRSDGATGGCWAEDPQHRVPQRDVATVLSDRDFQRRQSALYWKRCRGCGSNYALNTKLTIGSAVDDLRWAARMVKTERPIDA